MPNLDSLSFALLIPFAICFLLVFLLCCFADQIKEICRMPSQLPAYYLTPRAYDTDFIHATNSNRRHRSRRSRQEHGTRRSRERSEETRVLILNEGGRSRNNSEMSEELNTAQAHQDMHISRERARINTGVIICPQIIVSDSSFLHMPHTSIPTNIVPAPHTVTRSKGGVFGTRGLTISADINNINNTTHSNTQDRRLLSNSLDIIRANINRNRSVPSALTEVRQVRDNSSRSFRNLPSVIPLGLDLNQNKKS